MKALRNLFFISLLICSSCVNTKYVFKSNSLYRIHSDDPLHPTIDTFNQGSGFKAKITDNGSYLVINPTISIDQKYYSNIPYNKPLTGIGSLNTNSWYFPEASIHSSHSHFCYFDSKLVLQGLSIPLRIRPKLKDAALKDSFPPTVETGVNISLALGWKFNINIFSPYRNVLGLNTSRYSFSSGFLFGLGATDLTKSNTRDPIIVFPRKAPMISKGLFFMFGFNNLNIGYCLGIDDALGIGSKQWLYRNKVWHGVAIGFDLIK